MAASKLAGTISNRESALPTAKTLATSMPALLIEARRIGATILAGWHGRRRAGPGEAFWQFRPFVSGEPAAMIDWRRSGRDEQLYVREKEWEAAHTVWFAPDLTASMSFRSRLAPTDKLSRALVLSLALTELLAQAGERVGLLGEGPPILSRGASEMIAAAILTANPDPWPDIGQLARHSDLIIIGDFLDPIEEIQRQLDAIASTGARAHLVQVFDPIEETFPFSGRTEFSDPESGFRHIVGRAETIGESYRKIVATRRDRLRDFARRLDWTFLIHCTDRPAIEPVSQLYSRLADQRSLRPKMTRVA